MPKGRRRSAVAAAVDAGSSAENVERGVNELMELSERSGPPEIPDDLGNFRPEGAEPAPTRGARRAASRTKTREAAPPARKSRAQHLPTFEDEATERQLRAGGEVEEDIREATDLEAEAPQDDDADEEDEDAGEGDEGEEARQPDALETWRAEMEQRDARREAQLNAAIQEIQRLRGGAPAGGQPGAGSPLTSDPVVAEAAKALDFRSVLQVTLDDAAAAEIGLPPTAARKLETWFAANLYANNVRLAKLVAANEQAKMQHDRSAATEQARMQNVAEAFYRANPDLVDAPEVVNTVSAALANQYAGQIDDGQWINMTAQRVRQMLGRPARAAASARRGGIPASPRFAGGDRGRIRPAVADFGQGVGGNGHGRALDPHQKEILDLARFGMQ